MKRDILHDLTVWLHGKGRKPLVVRGARQVGKTWAVRELAASAKVDLIELNLERNPEYADIFKERSPEKVMITLERVLGRRIDRNGSLLFLDEIQKSPWIMASLRWFYEEMPGFPVVATGSLLDFSLADHSFSMPVGRISYILMEPMLFKEFLLALGEDILVEMIGEYSPGRDVEEVVHEKVMDLFGVYVLVGGMPAIVSEWVQTRSMVAVARAQQDLINTIADDFAKYAGRVPVDRLRKVLFSVPRFLGQKFKFSNVDRDEKAQAMKKALELLCGARVCHKVIKTDGGGVPLSAQADERTFKVLLMDTGLASGLSGLILDERHTSGYRDLVNRGGIAEQAAGQALRVIGPGYVDPQLHYYVREKRGSEAEIDYLIALGTCVYPVEVKSGSTGTLKSLHLFMAEKKQPLAFRINTELPSVVEVDLKTTTGRHSAYRLVSLPFSLVSEIPRLKRVLLD